MWFEHPVFGMWGKQIKKMNLQRLDFAVDAADIELNFTGVIQTYQTNR